MSTTLNLEVKDAKGQPTPPDCWKLVHRMLHHYSLVGEFLLRVGYRTRGASEKKGTIEIRGHDPRGVTLAVQYGDSNTRYDCFLTQKGVAHAELGSTLLKRAGGKLVRPDQFPKHGSQIPFPVAGINPVKAPPASISSANVPKADVSVVVPPVTPVTSVTPAEDKDPDAALLHGFTKDETNVTLLLDLIRKHHGSGEFTRERFKHLMRESGLCAKETSDGSLSQVLRFMADEQAFFNHKVGHGNMDYYSIAPRGDKLLASLTSHAENNKPRAGAFPPLDLAGFIAGMDRLMSTLKGVDDAVAELSSVQVGIDASNAEIARLKAELDPLLTKRDGFERRKGELQKIIADPTIVEARAKLNEAQKAIAVLQSIGINQATVAA